MVLTFGFRLKTLGLIGVGLLSAILEAAQIAHPKFEIRIERKFQNAACSSGYLLINGKPMCYVLEKRWVDNLPEISSIPAGTYPAFVRTDGSKGWRIELKNVPERPQVQLHVGNTPADSRGCLLPGMELDSSSLCAVMNSAAAMKKLRAAFEEQELNSASSIPITVVIAD